MIKELESGRQVKLSLTARQLIDLSSIDEGNGFAAFADIVTELEVDGDRMPVDQLDWKEFVELFRWLPAEVAAELQKKTGSTLD